jgi:dolichol-phosphate mannosyltransferase
MKDTLNEQIIIVIPTYKEEENIISLWGSLNKVYKQAPFSVIIIDDSPDKTSEKIKAAESSLSNNFNLTLIKRDTKLGLGTAYKEGFSKALDDGADIIIQMDADLSHSPFYILKMLEFITEYDLVVGSRYVWGGGIVKWSGFRGFISKTANFVSKSLLRVPINDLTSGFKVIKRQVLESIDFNSIKSKGYIFQMELILRAYDKGFKIKECPIIFRGREKEKSKFSFSIVLEAFYRVINFGFKRLFKDNLK